MARLPLPGGDDGNWGDILNTFLTTAHNTDGTLKTGSVDVSQLSAAAPTSGQVLSYNGTKFNWIAAGGGGVVTVIPSTFVTLVPMLPL